MSLAYFKTSIGGYFFDVTFSENHDFENTITQFPVQSGASINDNAYNNPVTLTLVIGVSDVLSNVQPGQFSSNPSRSISAFNVLQNLWQTKQQMDIYTSLCSYPNMIIKSLNITKDKTTMNALKATVILQQILVTNATVTQLAAVSGNPQVTDSTSSSAHTTPPTSLGELKISGANYDSTTTTFSSEVTAPSGKKYGKGYTMSLDQFFKTFSTSQATYNFSSNNYTITPLIQQSVLNRTFFITKILWVTNTYTYKQFVTANGGK